MSTHTIDAAGHEMTLDEWAALPEDTPGELVDGVLVEEEVPEFVHELLALWLGSRLLAWIEPTGGSVTGSGLKLGVKPRRGRMADVTVYFAGRKPRAKGIVRLPPDIAVEILSPSPKDQRRDRVDKLLEYAAFGIRYYIVVDPQARIIHGNVLMPTGRYELAVAAAEGPITIPGCDGLVLDLDLDAMWSYVDEHVAEGDEDDEA